MPAPSSPATPRDDASEGTTSPDDPDGADWNDGTVPPPIEWSATGGERARDVLRHLAAGALLGTGLLALLVVAFVAVSAVRSGGFGDSGALVLFVVLALVGGPLSLVYIAVAAGHGDPRRLLAQFPVVRSLRPWWLAVATPVGVALLVAGFAYPPLLVCYFLGFFGFAVAGSVLFPKGRLDPVAGTLTVQAGDREREHDLSGLRSFSARRVGSVVVCRLRYAGVRSLHGPFVVGVPVDQFDEIRPGLEAIRGRTDVEAAGQPQAVLAVLVAFGGFFLLVALGLGVLAWRSGEPSLAVYGGLMTGGLGSLFVWLAWLSRG